VWKWVTIQLVVAFVCWHLLVLVLRNPLDLWDEPISDWIWAHTRENENQAKKDNEAYQAFRRIDAATAYYGNITGAEQGWSMFTPNLARSAPFLAARIEFADGTSDLLKSDNEPRMVEAEDGTYRISYVRIGHARQRKLEDNLLAFPDDVSHSAKLSMYEAYARWCLGRWRQAHPDDPRRPERIVLVKRRMYFPQPGEDPRRYKELTSCDCATFDATGKFLPSAEGKDK
jgi:hypothetical protein